MQCQIRYLLLATLLPTASLAAEVDNASLETDLSYGYSQFASTTMQGLIELVPSLDLASSESTSLIMSARMRADVKDELEPGRPDLATYAPGSRPLQLGNTGTAELRDFYFEFRSANGLARFGKQQIVWGRLDGIKVLDLVNPQDFREFILDDFADSRISLWSAYFDYNIGNWRAEFTLVPDGTGHAIPAEGAWFELTAPRFRYGAPPGQPGLPVVTEEPGHSHDDTAAGLRLSRQFNTLELAVVAYTGNDPEPLGRLDSVNGAPVVKQFYERREAYGFSIDMGLGSAVLRAEYAYQPDRSFNTRSPGRLDTIELDQHRGAIGLDIDGPLGVFVNIQYLVDTVSSAPANLVRPGRDRLATFYMRRSFSYDSVVLAARWYHSFTDDDDVASFSIEYAINDDTSVEIAAQVFSGVDEGLFGQFTDRDRILLVLSHTF
jgi:hypothetical protein